MLPLTPTASMGHSSASGSWYSAVISRGEYSEIAGPGIPRPYVPGSAVA
jgi:hypothetical protein